MGITITRPYGITESGASVLPVFLLRAIIKSDALDGSRPVADRPVEVRATFMQRTYLHLFGAIAGFTAVECLLFGTGIALPIARVLLGASWVAVLCGIVLVSWIASRTARAVPPAVQYAALVGYVLAQAILFVPLLVLAQLAAPGTIESAAFVTLMALTGLTVMVWTTRRGFSFLGSLLGFAGVVALVLIAAGVLFGFELGTFFSVAMVALAGAAILHDTSNVLDRYPEDRYVGAALELFAFMALMSRRRGRRKTRSVLNWLVGSKRDYQGPERRRDTPWRTPTRTAGPDRLGRHTGHETAH